MASDQTFSEWYFAYCQQHNHTPGMEEVWNAALAAAPAQQAGAPLPLAPKGWTVKDIGSDTLHLRKPGIGAGTYCKNDESARISVVAEFLAEFLATPQQALPLAPSEAVALPFAILDDEMAALRRFYETTEDGQDYDVPVSKMKKLATIGLVRRVTGNRYEFTDFGLSVINGDFATPQQATLPASEAVVCDKPPKGWVCKRPAGHEGPCAASEDQTPMTREWCATFPGSAAGIINTLAAKVDELESATRAQPQAETELRAAADAVWPMLDQTDPRTVRLYAALRAQRQADAAEPVAKGGEQPRLKVRLTCFPESNGKTNWTALLVREEAWDGLVGNCGGVQLARGELWNRVAWAAQEAMFLIGERDTEPFILDYGDDIKTPAEWKGESGHPKREAQAPSAAKKEGQP